MVNLPKSKIVVKDGRVQSIEEWVLWNKIPAKTISIKRTENGFSSLIGDPEHGGSFREGVNLLDVLEGLHLDIKVKYIMLFEKQNVNVSYLQLHYPKYAIEVL
jgi:hypothetical protein